MSLIFLSEISSLQRNTYLEKLPSDKHLNRLIESCFIRSEDNNHVNVTGAGFTYVIVDFGWRLHIRRLIFEYQSWEHSCEFVLSVQLEKNNNS